jgi:hypothetical protein
MGLPLLRLMIKGWGRGRKKTVRKKYAPKKSAKHGRRGYKSLVGKKTE